MIESTSIKPKTEQEKLQDAIVLLRGQQHEQLYDLKYQFRETLDELRPSILLKKTFTDIYKEPELKVSISRSLVSIVTGIISRKLLVGKSNSLVKSILGFIIQFGATKLTAKKMKEKQE